MSFSQLLQYTTEERYARTAILSPERTKKIVRTHEGKPSAGKTATKTPKKIIAVFFVIKTSIH
jgi:hypothetical protein